MTIKGISQFLKKRLPGHRRRVPVSLFAGRRIAVDAMLYAYAYMATALGGEAKKIIHNEDMRLDEQRVTEAWLGRFISTLTLFKEAQLKPVFVFDGADVPAEKLATREQRGQDRNKVKTEIAHLRANLQDDEFEYDVASRERIAKLMGRDIKLTGEQLARLRKLLVASGAVVLDAPGEGEAYCAFLVKQGYCSALYSVDSDAGAYRTPVVITEIDNATTDVEGVRYQSCEVIYYKQVLACLQLTPAQYVDLCIMCGTDYNSNVPGKGAGKCYPLIKQYGSIEAIPDEKLSVPSAEFLADVDKLRAGLLVFRADAAENEAYVAELQAFVRDPSPKRVYNYQRVREIFNTVFTVEVGRLSEPVVDYTELNRLLAGYGVIGKAGRLLNLMRQQDGTGYSNTYTAVKLEDYEACELL